MEYLMTDAKLLAKQVVWAATTPEANQAFNVANGDIFSLELVMETSREYLRY
jgi:hypothetical protein